MFSALLQGFGIALSAHNLGWLLAGTAVGLVVGVLPAIGGTVGVALMLPFTYGLDLTAALVFLCAIHAAGQYGDSVSSILLNIPGGPGTVATCWDGYPMAQQGKAGRALGIATFSCLAGGLMGCLGLVALAWPLTELALTIGAAEYFALGIMALSLISIASKGETIKGLIMACLGLILSFVGEDPITGAADRFSFGVLGLAAGIPIVVSTLGIFALSQVIELLEQGSAIAGEAIKVRDSVWAGFLDVVRRPLALLRSGLVGMYVGILPALGVSMAGIASYLVEKKYSPERDRFGQGAPSGILAAEVGKGCCVVGDLIPTFTLGVPGSVTGAILMGALIVHGIQPGPMFLLSGAMPYAVFAGIILAQFCFAVSGLGLARAFSRLVFIPNALLAPAIAVLCFFGAYVERNSFFDIVLMVILGVAAYALKKLGYSVVCLVLGLIIGPLVETNFHRTLAMGFGSFGVFFTRPLAVAFVVITALFLGWPYLMALGARLRGRAGLSVAAGELPAAGGEEGRAGGRAGGGEFMLLGLLLAFGLVVFVQSGNYLYEVGLFPRLVSAGMVVLILWRGIGLLLVGGGRMSLRLPGVPLFSGVLPWPWAVGMFGVYLLLIYLVGFLAATAVYLLAVPLLMGYPRRKSILAVAVSSPVALIILARALRILLPAGMLARF